MDCFGIGFGSVWMFLVFFGVSVVVGSVCFLLLSVVPGCASLREFVLLLPFFSVSASFL